jgi:hypothetical protein
MHSMTLARSACILPILPVLSLALWSWLYAQDTGTSLPVQPAPQVRLTGVLEAVENPQLSTFPVLRVWFNNKPWRFRVNRVEPIIPAYRAEEELRKVSRLGLRFLAEEQVATVLLSAARHNQSIMVEGWLRVREGVLRVQSVRVIESPQVE